MTGGGAATSTGAATTTGSTTTTITTTVSSNGAEGNSQTTAGGTQLLGSGTSLSIGWIDQEAGQEMLECVNEERRAAGKSELRWNSKLAKAAEVRSKELVNRTIAPTMRPNGSEWHTAVDEAGYTGHRFISECEIVKGPDAGAYSAVYSWTHVNDSLAFTSEANEAGMACYRNGTHSFWIMLIGRR